MCPFLVGVTKLRRAGSTSQLLFPKLQLLNSALLSVLSLQWPNKDSRGGRKQFGADLSRTPLQPGGCWGFKGSVLSPLLLQTLGSRYPHSQEKRGCGRNAASGWTQGIDNQLELRGNFRFWSISNHFDPRYNLKCSCLSYYSPRALWVVFTFLPACSLSLLIRSQEQFNEKWVCGWRGQWRDILNPFKNLGRIWLCSFKQGVFTLERIGGKRKHLSLCQFFWLPAPALLFMESWTHWVIKAGKGL